jgi:hypothetical protein
MVGKVGGWNRVVLRVDDLPSVFATMKKAGFHFRNEIETGPGGKQIQVEDPDGIRGNYLSPLPKFNSRYNSWQAKSTLAALLPRFGHP